MDKIESLLERIAAQNDRIIEQNEKILALLSIRVAQMLQSLLYRSRRATD